MEITRHSTTSQKRTNMRDARGTGAEDRRTKVGIREWIREWITKWNWEWIREWIKEEMESAE